MKKIFLTFVLLSASAVSLQAGFGKSFGGSLAGSMLGSSLANAANNNNRSVDCSFEKEELRKAKGTNRALHRRYKKLTTLKRKIDKKKKAKN